MLIEAVQTGAIVEGGPMKNVLKESANEEIKKVGEIIGDVRVAMLTTLDEQHRLTSRPMSVQEVESSGTIWFFTTMAGQLMSDVNAEANVNLTFAGKGKSEFLSVSGRAEAVVDRLKMESLWHPSLKVWFKDGLETPDLCLLKVEMQAAEYWASPSSPVVKIAGFVHAMVSDQPYRPGEHHRVEMH